MILIKTGTLTSLSGGGSVPGTYGSFPPSFVFENDGSGHFTDISSKLFGGNSKIGMVTDAQWADIDNNGFDDLIIAGNWMGLLIYKNDKGIFTKDTVLEKYKGWWSSLEVADVNGDGMKDIIAGNLGVNSKFRASFDEPMKIFVKDFDENGTKECILSVYKSDHKQYVFHQRRDLADQLPSFKKKYLKYRDYAGIEFNKIFPKSATKGSETHEINFLESAVFFNDGNMQFSCKPFPYNAQLSTVNSILYEDINNDGNKDIILTGNFTDFKPEVGTLDANKGQVYEFKNGSFDYMSSALTGLEISGQVRSSLAVKNKKGAKYFIFGRNNAPLSVYQLK